MEIDFQGLTPAQFTQLYKETQAEFTKRYAALKERTGGLFTDPPLERSNPLHQIPNTAQAIIRACILNPNLIEVVTTSFTSNIGSEKTPKPGFILSWTSNSDEFVNGFSILPQLARHGASHMEGLSMYYFRFLSGSYFVRTDGLHRIEGIGVCNPAAAQKAQKSLLVELARSRPSQFEVLTELTAFLLVQ